MIDFIFHLPAGYVYPALFIGISFVGGLVLLPALYLTIAGPIKLSYLCLVVFLAGVSSDTIWYVIGRKAKKDHLYRIPFIQKRMEEAEKFSTFFVKHSLWLLYVTKFIYGTRIASHVLAGMHKIRYSYFLFSTELGTLTWFWLFYLIVRMLDVGIDTAKSAAFKIQLILLVGTVLIIVFNWLTGKYLKDKLFKEHPTKK